VSAVWARPAIAHEAWLAHADVAVHEASAQELSARCGSSAHQGLCAEVEPYRYVPVEALLDGDSEPLLVVLDQVQDPQNLGAICRSAECAGSTGVVIGQRRCAEVTAAVCKASAGAVEHLRIARARNIADFLLAARRAGIWCYGADAGAKDSYESVNFAGAAALVLGSEGRGLRPRVASCCDQLVAIPLRGRVQSLSVSAAAAVLLYAAVRCRESARR
jgi:23S rRNA (guanosine2251-2'-O)-methyltransferase